MRIADSVEISEDGTARCAHCSAVLGSAGEGSFARTIVNERDPAAAGPNVHVPADRFTDRPVVLRQVFCPECLVVLSTEIAPADEPSYRRWDVVR